MKRRTLLKCLLSTAVMAPGFRLPLVRAENVYNGKLFVFVQADGGWDPTSFCDPKANTPGEKVINHWAETETRSVSVGNIPYAPFAGNQAFFEKYHRMMLVINGVDAQTNSHTVGIVHNWSGRNAEGYPTTAALLAAHFASDLPVPYLSFGGYSATGGITRFTRIDNADLLRKIANPATEMFSEASWAAIESYQRANAERLASRNGTAPRVPFATESSTARRSQPRASRHMRMRFPQRRTSSKPESYTGAASHLLQQVASTGTVDGARIQDRGRGERRPLARRLRHPHEPRPATMNGCSATSPTRWTTCGTTPRSTAWPTAWWW